MDDLLLGPLGLERGRPDEAVARRRRQALPALLALVAALSGCGSDDGSERVGSSPPGTGEGGGIAYALPGLPNGLDPLAAEGAAAAIVSRQVHEPLVASVAAPYGGRPQPAGLATAIKASPDRTLWTLQLRAGVSFQDGTPFNAAAVLVNSRRWTSTAAGRALLPELFAVDAPRPGEVRFLLRSPVGDLGRRLADPRLAIVSPRALDPQSGEGSRFRPGARGSGTGAFVAGRQGGGGDELIRNPDWWGTREGLGPALESVRFVAAATAAQRAAALRSGRVQVAGPLPPAELRRLAADPLLIAVPGAGGGLAASAEIRGLPPRRPLPLISAIWLTRLTG